MHTCIDQHMVVMVTQVIYGNKPEIVLIAALAENRTIGNAGKVPWHLPEDLQRFRSLTLHHTVILGRKTWELDLDQRPLSDRTHIIVSKSYFKAFSAPPIPSTEEMIYIVPSIAAALEQSRNQRRVFIIGGATLYAQTLHLADRLELTLVEGHIAGDTFFPVDQDWLQANFALVQESPHAGYRFLTYQRKTRSS